MELTLNRANIILVAPNHRPDIVSKEWLNQKNILNEIPTNFEHRQNRSLVETVNYSINVVQQRVTIVAKNSDQEVLNSLQTIANEYIRELPDVSYNAVGFNSNWKIVTTNPDLLKTTFIQSQEKFNEVFHGDTNYNIGGVVFYKHDTYRVRLIVVPEADNQIVADFNYHSDITTLEQLRESISYSTKAIDHARDAVRKLLGD